MKDLTLNDLAALDTGVTTWALVWKLYDRSGEVLRQTSHDVEIVVDLSTDDFGMNGSYQPHLAFSASQAAESLGLSADNMEVDALLDSQGITASDVEAGMFRDVEYVLMQVNWRDPTNSGIVVKRGKVGDISSFLDILGNIELLGLKHRLQQVTTQLIGPTCRAVLGDGACGVDLTPYTLIGTVASETTSKVTVEISVSESPSNPEGWYTYGVAEVMTGANVNHSSDIKVETLVTGNIRRFTFLEPFPYGFEIGDQVLLSPGCDHGHSVSSAGVVTGDCKNKYDNVINFQGEPDMPQPDSLVEAP